MPLFRKFSWKKLWKFILRLLLWMFITSTLYLVICKWVMPPVTLIQLESYVAGDGLQKVYVGWEEISPNVKLAAIAGEDQLFPEHGGFDWKALEKSMEEKNTRRKRHGGAGASTISQQTAKNVFLWQGGGAGRYVRKVPEFYFTKGIEWVWGKQRILHVYLNTVEMGKGVFGIEAAARQYFKKSAKNLSAMEAASIIACLPNPKRYTVVPMSRWVAWRRQIILRQMNNIAGDKEVRDLIK